MNAIRHIMVLFLFPVGIETLDITQYFVERIFSLLFSDVGLWDDYKRTKVADLLLSEVKPNNLDITQE